ncbi:MAG: YciI family protein [Pseudomonadota bacterium]
MQYLLMIHEDESIYEGDEGAKLMEATLEGHMKLIEALTESGKEWSGNRLQGAATATTLKYKSGKSAMHDGPFAETHEELGGYYLVEADDLDGALEWAKMIPVPGDGAVEVRPVWQD